MEVHKPNPIFKLIVKGDNPIYDNFIQEILDLPDKTNVFHLTTNKMIPPIEYIGGREIRSIGDTCRMFYKVKRNKWSSDYFFWDGIVSERLNEIDCPHSDDNDLFDKLWDIFYPIADSLDESECGLATGRTVYRIVLTEKVRKKKAFL
ncbi:MAG TPA: hypothetical protein VNX68_02830 [Nitrosopumilaceae archaeon]|jgi:hypothetical protein|nr:hypothetical protein [Nitrosopumilaceae archaeon]